MVPIGKCYYCGGYFELAEAGDWMICVACDAEEREYELDSEREREWYVMKDEEAQKYLIEEDEE